MSKFKNFFVAHDGEPSTLGKIYQKDATKSILSSLISIAIGLVFGLVIMIAISIFSSNITFGNALNGIGILLKGPFASLLTKNLLRNTGDVIFYAVPLIFTGLSIGIAYKTGLFNIGAPGQFIMGIIGALTVGLYIQTTTAFTGVLVWLLAVVTAFVFAAIWAVIPGLLKALFNINEVIVGIMTNWIAANIASWYFSKQTTIISKENTKGAYLITTKLTGNSTPTLGLNKIFPGSYIDIGIIIAILVAIAIYIVMNKTTFGYSLKACGSNRNAAKYAGLNEKKYIVLSMVIAGGMAGIGAALYYLNPGIEYQYASQFASLPAYGFNGIASAFLANCNPIGIVFSSLFIRYLNMGGEFLTRVNFNRYIADIIIAIIIYTAGFSRIVREVLLKNRKKQNEKIQVIKELPKKEEEGGKA